MGSVYLLFLSVLGVGAISPPSAIDAEIAKRYFQEAKWASDDDGGKLWGKPLYGPMIFVDPRTREAVANESPPVAFEETSGVFRGRLPDQVLIANYALPWGGKRWTMVMWPLPENRAERATLMMHELFHRIQPEIGFPMSSPKNAHLETFEGRLWLQLEIAALAQALRATSAEARNRAALDALLFRHLRQGRFENAKLEEDQLDLNEGLAQFTGYMSRGGFEPESRQWLGNQLAQAGGRSSYTRSFAYLTGSAYGFLLNVGEAVKFNEIRWRKALKPDSSLAGLLAELMQAKLDLPEEEIVERAKPYGFEDVRRAEEKVAAERAETHAKIRREFLESPVLVIPITKMNFSFRPDGIVSLGSDGTYYPTATVLDEWGRLEVEGGMLLASDMKSLRVTAPPSGAARAGKGWKLTLSTGWKIVPSEKAGDFTVSKG